jgi:hypothetical protein
MFGMGGIGLDHLQPDAERTKAAVEYLHRCTSGLGALNNLLDCL